MNLMRRCMLAWWKRRVTTSFLTWSRGEYPQLHEVDAQCGGLVGRREEFIPLAPPRWFDGRKTARKAMLSNMMVAWPNDDWGVGLPGGIGTMAHAHSIEDGLSGIGKLSGMAFRFTSGRRSRATRRLSKELPILLHMTK
jgi:hypothetical protein